MNSGSMRGIVTVLNTPFTDDNSLDTDGLRRNVALALEAGVAGFLVCGLAGEVHSLSAKERARLVATVVDDVAGKVPVIGGTADSTQSERLQMGKRLLDLGCRGLLVNIPLNHEAEFEEHVSDFANLGPEFVMLQDWDPVGPGLPVPLITRLCESIPLLTWLKIEVIPAGPKYTQVMEATNGRLNIAGGWAVMQMIEALDRGVQAFMPTGMHRIYVEIYNRYASGRRDEAIGLFRRILPVLVFSNQNLELSILFFKRLLHEQGIYAAPHVRTTSALDSVQARSAEALIELINEIEHDLPK